MADFVHIGQRANELRQSGLRWRQIGNELDINPDAARMAAKRWAQEHGEESRPEPDQLSELEILSLEELFQLARQSQRAINLVDPVITNAKKTFTAPEPIGIIFVSCSHLGSRYTFYDDFERIFNQVLNTPRLYWLSLGDDVEGFLSGFPDASAVTDQAIANPKIQRLMLAHVLDKLAEKNKLLAGCASQHGGDWTRRKTGDDPIKDLYLARRVPYFDGKGLLSLHVGKQTYRVALAHEFPGSSIYNSNHAQRRAALFDFPNADLVVQGDKHKYAVTEMSLPPAEFDAGLRESYMQWLVQVGTAKAGPDKYSIRGWSRGVLEWPVMIFHANEHRIEYTRDLDRARLMLNA